MANQFLGLSLFVMLLSFFIILNAMSNFEETKSKPVLNSIALTFSKKEATDVTPPGPALVKTTDIAMQDGSALDKIEALFKSQITAIDTKQNRLGTMMYMRVRFKDFDRAVRKSLVISSGNPSLDLETEMDLLPMLVSLLETQRDVTYKMDIVLNIPEDPSTLMSENPQRFASLNKSVSGLAQILEEAGLPKHQVTSGLKQGEDGIAELLFRRYQPFNPLRGMEKSTGNASAPSGENNDAQEVP
ncbi:MAG: hypothetical protein H6861_01100 [Rhodospirillales bacterium]|nr:hypothetical protein [Rhodospirillales bacterium]